ncbi:hypothetical protein BN439_2573 [Erwinia amylovora Ea644]|nr:hypothetical protein BN439_2573 [Erwinia amylovora Ea644]CCP07659.1 hypothetical protein BN440_2645 [Erwinia amylovora MR1]
MIWLRVVLVNEGERLKRDNQLTEMQKADVSERLLT